MSNEGFRGVPGVPDGWELVHANRQAESGEYFLDAKGCLRPADHRTNSCYPIIRKTQKPAKYRQFKDAEEFKPHRDRWVRVIKEHNMSGCDLDDWLTDSLRFMGQDKTGVCAPGGWLTYGCAFDCFVFDDDGTPFGVRIDE